MNTLASGVFKDLNIAARRAIADFQRYVVDMYRSRAARWPAAKSMVQAIAAEVVSLDGHAMAPIQLVPIAKALHVAVDYKSVKTGHRGGLMPIPGGFRLAIYGQFRQTPCPNEALFPSSDEWRCPTLLPRGRFTMAHELGHVFFYTTDVRAAIPERLIPRKIGKFLREEGLCHDFARALLIPSSCQAAIRDAASLSELVSAARMFGVTTEPMLRRILYDWDMWVEALFASVSRHKGRLKVHCFRGSQRKGKSKLGPTRGQIAERLGSTTSMSQARRILQRTYALESRSILRSADTLWLML